MREIDSALTYLLEGQTDRDERKQKNLKESRKEQIANVARRLGFPDDAPVIERWSSFSFHDLAHRPGLEEPRRLDAAFRDRWSTFQDILLVVLGAFEAHFLNYREQLAPLFDHPTPAAGDIPLLMQYTPRSPIVADYFFTQMQQPGWIHELRQQGFFSAAPDPEPIPDEPGRFRLVSWPQARYLARVAPERPDVVQQIISDLPFTANGQVYVQLIDVLNALPSANVAALAPDIEEWVTAMNPTLFAMRLASVMQRLARDGHVDAALALANILLAVPAEADAPRWNRPQPGMGLWEYDEIVRKRLPQLAEIAGERLLNLLVSVLEAAVGPSLQEHPSVLADLYWAQPIWDYGQPERPSFDVLEALVPALRDTAITSVGTQLDAFDPVTASLLASRWSILRRIGLHLYREFPQQGAASVDAALADLSWLAERVPPLEYQALLAEQFGNLQAHTRDAILETIAEGPDLDQYHRGTEAALDRAPTDDEITAYQRFWRSVRLEPLASNLNDVEKERFAQLGVDLDEAPRPVRRLGLFTWTGPQSPVSSEGLAAKTIPELVQYLTDFTEAGPWAPSVAGLAQTLSEAVASAPAKYAAGALEFARLPLPYVENLLLGLDTALGHQRHFEWAPVLQLGEVLLRHGEQENDVEETSRSGKALIDLIDAGLSPREQCIAREQRDTVWGIISSLAKYEHPTAVEEAGAYAQHQDVALLAHTGIRPAALQAAMKFSAWFAEDVAPGHTLEPEVQRLLESHLDVNHDPSLAVRYLYGWHADWLATLDLKWASANLNAIFPTEPELVTFWKAAWSAFLWECPSLAHDLLRDQYGHAVVRLGGDDLDERFRPTDRRLAEHLVELYIRGLIHLNDGHLVAFFERAPLSTRIHALSYLGRVRLHQTPIVDVLERATALWDWRRRDVGRNVADPRELSGFGWWFVSRAFPDDWSLAELARALELGVAQFEVEMLVVERLSELTAVNLKQTTRCLRLLVDNMPNRQEALGWLNYAAIIVEQAIASADAETVDDATVAVNRLAAAGVRDSALLEMVAANH